MVTEFLHRLLHITTKVGIYLNAPEMYNKRCLSPHLISIKDDLIAKKVHFALKIIGIKSQASGDRQKRLHQKH